MVRFAAHLHYRFRWLHLPGAILVTLLQRSPAIRVVASAEGVFATSPVGAVLRSAVASLASLGVVHALAGASTFLAQQGQTVVLRDGDPPQVSIPVLGTVGTPIVPVLFTVIGALTPAGSYLVTNLAPGLIAATPAGRPATSAGLVDNTSTGIITGTPTTAGTFTTSLLAYEFNGGAGTLGNDTIGPVTITFIISQGTPVAPTFTLHPASQSVTTGASVTFSAAANGSPSPAYQWQKNAANIIGATAATLVLTDVQPTSAGTYVVVATNASGSVTSNPATLTVSGAATGTAPTLVAQPLSVSVATGSTAALTVVANGSPAPTYQWLKAGAVVAGATDATLKLSNVTTATAGSYSVVATNSTSAVTSNSAVLTVATGLSRLANLSVRTNLAASATLIVGFNTSGAKSVLIRGVGPTLGAFGVAGAYADPRLELYDSNAAIIESNDNWTASLASAFSAVGAFALTAGSKDAALAATVSGGHTAQLKGPGSGVVLVELYDSGAGTTVRLINVSARNAVGTGDDILIAGFVIDGLVAKTVLIRAIGPTLASFGVGGTLADPKLEIYSSAAAKVVENDNWSSTLAATANSVGAFPLSANSRDAALLVTLPPGNYTAQVRGADGGIGEALIEIYEVQ